MRLWEEIILVVFCLVWIFRGLIGRYLNRWHYRRKQRRQGF